MILFQRGTARAVAVSAPDLQLIASPARCLDPGLILAAAVRLRDATGWAIAGMNTWAVEAAISCDGLRPAMDFLSCHRLADVKSRGRWTYLVRPTEEGLNALDYMISATAILSRYDAPATLGGVGDYTPAPFR